MRKYLFVLLFLMCSAEAWAVKGAGEVGKGNRFYQKEKYAQALEQYEKADVKNPTEAKISYDLGAAAYKSGDYERAVQYFQKSLLTDDDVFKKDVNYNLGNSFYKAGASREDKDIQGALKLLKESLDSLEKVRATAPDDKDAVNNYNFVKQEIERLKQKQQKQQQEKQDQKNQKDQQQDSQKQDKQDNQGQKDQAQQKQGQEDQQKQGQQQDQGQRGAQEQKDGLKDKEQADKKDSQQGQSQDQKQKDEPAQGKDENKAASGQEAEGQISSQKEAQAMVDEFERNELPKGLLNFAPRQDQPHPVEKDW